MCYEWFSYFVFKNIHFRHQSNACPCLVPVGKQVFGIFHTLLPTTSFDQKKTYIWAVVQGHENGLYQVLESECFLN
jgi:hypothetical protein